MRLSVPFVSLALSVVFTVQPGAQARCCPSDRHPHDDSNRERDRRRRGDAVAWRRYADRQRAAPVQTASAAEISRGSADLFEIAESAAGWPACTSTSRRAIRSSRTSTSAATPHRRSWVRQGISLFMDGVRLNQPFGQIVSWDLAPRMAIRSLTFMPGSNPVFGLNTLGGALALETKTGLSAPGTTVQGVYSSNARKNLEFEHGGSRSGGLHWYMSGNLFNEHGWRDDSPSNVRQISASSDSITQSIRHRTQRFVRDNELTGNGLQSVEFLRQNRASVYTKPGIRRTTAPPC